MQNTIKKRSLIKANVYDLAKIIPKKSKRNIKLRAKSKEFKIVNKVVNRKL